MLRMSWSLSNRERVIAKGVNDPPALWLGFFDAGTGRYTLDLDVWDDGSRLNAWAPHLKISEAGGTASRTVDDAMGRAFATLLLLVALGTLVLIRGRRERQAAWVKAHCLTQPGPLPPLAGGRPQATPAPAAARAYSWAINRNRHRKLIVRNVPAFARLSGFSLLLVPILVVLEIPFVVIAPIFHKGLLVRLVRPEIPAQSTPWLEPLRVRVALAGPKVRPKLYLNSQLVSWEDFGTVLQKELNRRPPHWPVYVEGDPDLLWQEVAKAIDAVRGLQAEVVLLTTETASPQGRSGSTATPKPARTPQLQREPSQ